MKLSDIKVGKTYENEGGTIIRTVAEITSCPSGVTTDYSQVGFVERLKKGWSVGEYSVVSARVFACWAAREVTHD